MWKRLGIIESTGLVGIFALALLAGAAKAQAEPDYIDYVESSLYPIRVHYATASASGMADEVLTYAEGAWEAEILGMGFPAPITEDASGNRFEGLWIYLVPNSPSGYAEVIADNPDTEWTDCTTRVILPEELPSYYIESYVYHESNHAMQMALDCTEAWFAYENTTVAVEVLLFPDDSLWMSYFLPTYQTYPHHGVDCTFFGDQLRAYYHYGAALFGLFLEEYAGDADGTLLSEIWHEARQPGTVTITAMGATSSTPNEPDLMDAMQTVLADRGIDFDDAFAEFAQWRYFLGDNDDGEHFANGALWAGAEVVVQRIHVIPELPVLTDTVDFYPNDYGTVYMELDLDELESPLGVVFGFEGTTDTRWRVHAVTIQADGTNRAVPVSVDEAGVGEAALAGVAGADRLLFVISVVGDGTHDPDGVSCQVGHGFSYSLRLADLETTPVITSVSPDRMAPGKSERLTVQGSGFLEGITAEFSGTGLTVFSVQRMSDTTLELVVTADSDATDGARDLVLINPNNLQGTLEGAVTVGSDTGTPGCGCRHGGGADFGLGMLLLLAFLGLRCRGRLLRGRPRRSPSQD